MSTRGKRNKGMKKFTLSGHDQPSEPTVFLEQHPISSLIPSQDSGSPIQSQKIEKKNELIHLIISRNTCVATISHPPIVP